ncbi:hypothetical protein [Pseudorhodobacter sp.]|uniref:hypothetical protein n=1 Tax=Pseudorhodobacter sp. TaxID=1934400 RepID=UPI002AFFA31A|nr:hypothetical protein [Pseudorhodobacter sp.]
MIAGLKLPSLLVLGLLVSAGGIGQAFSNPLPLVLVQDVGIPSVATLAKTLRIGEVIDVMRLEGLSYGTEMEGDLFPGKGGAAWVSVVELIYDGPTMQRRFEEALAARLAGHETDMGAMQQFFAADLGQRILKLEIEARRSLMDQAVEDAAKARVEEMMAEAVPRFDALQAFSEVNDLVEMNISGAMNSNLAFFQGMAEVGAMRQDLTEEDMLMDVWGQEPEIRAETESWVFPYLALAYGPLSDEELAAYIEFSETGPGQTLNTAVFGAFDTVFAAISRDLGRAAARQIMGEDI